MSILKGWKLDLKQKYGLPFMFTKIMFKSCETEEECLEYIAKTSEPLCWSCLDYRDSEEVKELRRDYGNNTK